MATIGPGGLDGQTLISYQIFVRDAKQELASEEFPDWLLPIDQFRNLAGLMAQFGSGTSAQPFKTVDDYADWRKRASQVPVLFDQAIANMKQGVEAGVVQLKALMGNVVSQLDELIKDKPEDTLFWMPYREDAGNILQGGPRTHYGRLQSDDRTGADARVS